MFLFLQNFVQVIKKYRSQNQTPIQPTGPWDKISQRCRSLALLQCGLGEKVVECQPWSTALVPRQGPLEADALPLGQSTLRDPATPLSNLPYDPSSSHHYPSRGASASQSKGRAASAWSWAPPHGSFHVAKDSLRG